MAGPHIGPRSCVSYDPVKPKPAIANPYSGVQDLRPGSPVEPLWAVSSMTPQWVREAFNVEPLGVLENRDASWSSAIRRRDPVLRALV